MALLNPVYALVLPFLCIFTIPLAIFAGITTTLAFSVLMVRVAVVYLDMALAFVPQYILGRSGTYPRSLSANYYQQYGWEQPVSPSGSIGSAVAGSTSRGGSGGALASGQITSSTGLSYSVPGSVSGGAMVGAFAGSDCRSPKHRNPAPSLHTGSGSTNMSGGGGGCCSIVVLGRQSRRSSQASMVSVSTITPIREAAAEGDTPLPSSSSWCGSASVLANSSGLIPSVGLGRDFEGVGGWRLDADDDDSDWAKINRRLELPHDRAPSWHHQRRQSASRSGGATTPVETAAGGSGSNTWLMMKSSLRKDSSPEARERERGDRMAGGSGSGKLSISPNSSRLRINQGYQVPTPLTTIKQQQQQGESYFPMLVPPKALKKASA